MTIVWLHFYCAMPSLPDWIVDEVFGAMEVFGRMHNNAHLCKLWLNQAPFKLWYMCIQQHGWFENNKMTSIVLHSRAKYTAPNVYIVSSYMLK